MDINITQTCVEYASSSVCEEYLYSGSIDNIQLSIPMLEAMGLIILWIVICFMVSFIIYKFT